MPEIEAPEGTVDDEEEVAGLRLCWVAGACCVVGAGRAFCAAGAVGWFLWLMRRVPTCGGFVIWRFCVWLV